MVVRALNSAQPYNTCRFDSIIELTVLTWFQEINEEWMVNFRLSIEHPWLGEVLRLHESKVNNKESGFPDFLC